MFDALFAQLPLRERWAVIAASAPPSLALGLWVLPVQGFGLEPLAIALLFSGMALFALVLLGALPMMIAHDLLERFQADWPVYAGVWAAVPLAIFLALGDNLQWLPGRAMFWAPGLVVLSAAGGGWVFHHVATTRPPRGGQ